MQFTYNNVTIEINENEFPTVINININQPVEINLNNTKIYEDEKEFLPVTFNPNPELIGLP